MEFEQLYITYFDDVYRYIRKLSRNEHVAEEITSDTFFKAMSAIDSFRNDCDFRVWLCQIAKNSYYSYLRKQKKLDNLESFELENIVDLNSFIEEGIVNAEQVGQIQQILHGLPEPYKEVFMWRVFADFSFKQIGQIFGKTDNWACVTYHRAKTMIKTRMEENSYEK